MPEAKKASAKKLPTAARRAVNGVKSAPQKIVEHALNTALTTVEKAAQTDIKRATKRAKKTAEKLKKVQKIAHAADTEVKRVSALSSDVDKLSHTSKKTNNKLGIKEKIKEIISPQKERTFYYDRRQLIVLTALYALFSIFVYMVSVCLNEANLYNNWFLFVMLAGTQIMTLLALASILFVTIVPQTLAVTNKDGITIDHNALLYWDDIEVAEEKYTSYLTRRPFIALHVHAESIKNYKLTFMQKLCKNNIFTPFSIPMYAMRPEDAAEIRNIIKHHVKYKDNRN